MAAAGGKTARMSTNAQEHAMISPTDIFSPLRELAHRSADGIDVTLMWNPADDSAFVVVVDLKVGTMFEVGVEDANPMHVFNHPYAYARDQLAA
jgi:hypothetical protein